MTVDIDTILAKSDFAHPLLMEFIMDRYSDLKETDPESARKIETKVFDEKFLRQALAKGGAILRSQVLRGVPESHFAPVLDAVEAVLTDESGYGYGAKKSAVRILTALCPERLKAVMTQAAGAKQGETRALFWLTYAKDLPQDLLQDLFEQTYPDLKSLQASERAEDLVWVMGKTLEAAVRLNHPDLPVLVTQYLLAMVRAYEEGEMDFQEWCFRLFHGLSDPALDSPDEFELELFFLADRDGVRTLPLALDRLYEKGWEAGALWDFFKTLIAAQDLRGFTDLEALGAQAGKEGLRFSMVRTLTADQEVFEAVRSRELGAGLKAVCGALFWQAQRRRKIDLSDLKKEDLEACLALDISPLPYKEELRRAIAGLGPFEALALKTRVMAAGLEQMKAGGAGDQALANVLALIDPVTDRSLIPLVAEAFVLDLETGHDAFYDSLMQAAVLLGDGMIDVLDKIIPEVPAFRHSEIFDVIRRIGTDRAEKLLDDHFDLFVREHRAETLNTAKGLVSEKILDRVIHKKGKHQAHIDELFVIVRTFKGEGSLDLESFMAQMQTSRQRMEAGLSALESDLPRDEVILELTCTCCGDVSDYPCRSVLVSRGGQGVVAQELTCISCGQICEFDITRTGQLALISDLMRISAQDEEEGPRPGAVQVIEPSFFGRPMSIPEGLARYKEKIKAHPSRAEFRLGLGNAYKFLNQFTLARVEYEKAIELAPFNISAYLKLAQMEDQANDPEKALAVLERGRPYLKRPLIDRDQNLSVDEVMASYLNLHGDLRKKTGSQVPLIRESEIIQPGTCATKIGPNEKCPCGSGKKYKKCCKGKH